MKKFLCAIETGSYSPPEVDRPTRYERINAVCICGHNHHRYERAQECMDRLRRRNDARWLSAHIQLSDGTRADPQD